MIVGNRKDEQLGKDRDAYKRMRDQKLQPERLNGAAEIESKAETRLEVERSTILTPDQRRQVETLRSEGADV